MWRKLRARINMIKVWKVAAGCALAMLLAEALSLRYASTAAVVTLLTIQDTKKETLLLAWKRVLSFLTSLLLSGLLYHLFPWHPAAYGVYMLLLTGISYYFKWEGAISVNAVIGVQILMEPSYSLSFLGNEGLLLLIGTSIAIALNWYMPDKGRHIKKDMQDIEDQLQKILGQLGSYMLRLDKSDLDGALIQKLDEHLDRALVKALDNWNNTLHSHSSYYIQYMEMRKGQCALLESMHEAIHCMDEIPVQAGALSVFLQHIGRTTHVRNNADELVTEMGVIFEEMRKEPLPVTRKEFENRAILYHLMLEIEEFLILKQEFVRDLTEEQVRIYWEE